MHDKRTNTHDRRGYGEHRENPFEGIHASFLPKDTATFRVVRDGRLYHLENPPANARHNRGYVYARWDGAKTLTAIHPQTHVVLVSVKEPETANEHNDLLVRLRECAISVGVDSKGEPTVQLTESEISRVVWSFIKGEPHEPKTTVAES